MASAPFEQLRAALRLPVIVAPMFLISGPELVIAAARAGVIGAFPAPNARSLRDLESWLERIAGAVGEAGKGGLWAINLIVHSSYPRLAEECDLVARYRPRLVISALGSPRPLLERVHDYGGLVFADVVSAAQARKAVAAGVDGLVLVASGAGGHTGQYSPFALVSEVRRFWDGPLVLAGAIGDARAILAARILGADLAYMGTRFIATPESLVSDDNRAMLVRAGLEDIVTSRAVTGVSANWLRESLDRAGFTADRLAGAKKTDFSNLQDVSAWEHIWGAGQAVGATRGVQTVAEIVDELARDYAALARSAPADAEQRTGMMEARA